MTPLFHDLVKRELAGQSVIPELHREPMLAHLGGAACFDYTAVRDLVYAMAEDFVTKGDVAGTTFLPAPVCFFEADGKGVDSVTQDADGRMGRFRMKVRKGVLLREERPGVYAGWQVRRYIEVSSSETPREPLSFEIDPVTYNLKGYLDGLAGWDVDAARERYRRWLTEIGDDPSEADRASVVSLYDEDRENFAVEEGSYPLPSHLSMLLGLINTPNIIGRVTNEPHTGLAKRIRRAGMGSRFPLRAWTEIKLSVTAPTAIDDRTPAGATLTGGRAFHFCRAHLRLRNGRLEHVRAHTRGDPQKGVKRSRYRVKK